MSRRPISRPVSYDPNLAFRNEFDDKHFGNVAARKLKMKNDEMKDALGIEDEFEESEEDEMDNDELERIKEEYFVVKEELKAAVERERKVQDSLSTLQLMNKSQTTILMNKFKKKICEKEKVMKDMVLAMKNYEQKLCEAHIDMKMVSDQFDEECGGEQSDAILIEDDSISKELESLRNQIQKMNDDKEDLENTIQGMKKESKGVANLPLNDTTLKAKLIKSEQDKKKLIVMVKELQLKLQKGNQQGDITAIPTPPPTNGDTDIVVQLKQKNQEYLEKLKNAATQIQTLKAGSKSTTIEDAESIAVSNQQLQNLKDEHKVQVQKLQNEISKIKDHAKRAIIDLRRKVDSKNSSGEQLLTQIQVLSDCTKQQRKQVLTLKNEVQTQFQNVPIITKQIGQQIAQRIAREKNSMTALAANYQREMTERKKLFNLVQELKGNIRVLCRFRPMSKNELNDGSQVVAKISGTDSATLVNEKGKAKTWEFDHIFGTSSTQEELFNEVEPLVTSILDGYNVCIFAYGQTGSGKTFTMAGPESNPGINTRSIKELFDQVERRRNEFHDEISISIMEIYNEKIRDLLSKDKVDKNLQVRQGPNGNYVPDLTSVQIQEYEQVNDLITLGNSNRSTHATDMNEHSSRSHSVFSVNIKSTNLTTKTVYNGKVHLVDLAGSERLSKTGATGQRLKEAQNINKSLSALGDVIASRASKSTHVPYRNSQLTYLLQDSLGGDSKTLMVACASPVDLNADETFCTLNFAARTRSVEMGKASKNVQKQ